MNREQLGEWLSAYLDGEVSEKQKELIERVLREDEGARRLLDELRRTVVAVSSLPRHAAPDSITEDVQFHVERSELLSDVEVGAAESTGRRTFVPAIVSTAAVLGLAVGGLWIMLGEEPAGQGVQRNMLAMEPRDSDAEEYLSGDLRKEQASAQGGKVERSARRRLRATPSTAVATGEAADQPSIPARAAPTDQREDEDGLVATASFDQKLRAGMGLASVRRHAFSNESVRLRVSVRDEAKRDAVTRKLVAYLTERHAYDLDDAAPEELDRAARTGSFFYRGRANVNFADTNQRQLLVRASRRDLEGMLDELAGATGRKGGVTLVAGPLSIRDVEQARTALYWLNASERPVEGEPLPRSRDDEIMSQAGKLAEPSGRTDQPAAESGRLFDELFRAIRVDPDGLVKALKPADDVEEDDQAAAGRTAVAGRRGPGTEERPMPPAAAGTSGGPSAADSGKGSLLANRGIARVGMDSASTLAEDARASERTAGLVDRRINALKQSRFRRSQPADATIRAGGAAAQANAARPPAEQYVTLVVEVRVEERKPAVGKPPSRNGKTRPARR